MSKREVISVGIDIGTTTSQLALSRLTIRSTHRPGLVPRLEIEDRKILYQGEPRLTPLLSATEVDVDALLAMMHEEYARAGVEPTQVETGAVIITGETARTKNADIILQGLSDLAGDFVVTVAGPDLEAQIAGRGSGAAQWSRQNYANVVNIDIGGGSANAAFFQLGRHVSSSAVMVGGRQAVVNASTGVLDYLAPPGKHIVEREHIEGLVPGQPAALPALRCFTDAMAEAIVDLALGQACRYGEAVELSAPLSISGSVDSYFLSGGVGALYYEDAPATTLAEACRYGDVGPLLARSLLENSRWQGLKARQPAQTQRATVLGAASQQVSLSGSTIWADADQLPLRNLPVIEPDLASLGAGVDVRSAIEEAVTRWVTDEQGAGQYAISLLLPRRLRYDQVAALADTLVKFALAHGGRGHPLVLVINQDYAQILGQTIRGIDKALPLIVIDQIGLSEGDFIDIGKPMFDGRVVPVSVKTLVFYQ